MKKGDIEILDAVPGHGGARFGSGRKPKSAYRQDSDDLFDAAPQQDIAGNFAKARARKEAALADMGELQFKIKSGEYVERAAVQEASATLLSALAQSLRSLPDNLERKFHVSPEVAEEIGRVIDDTLADIADGLSMFSDEAVQ